MKKRVTNMAASVHDRLLTRAKAENRPFNELLQYYAMERFLYRLSRSDHVNRFVLKGALMLQFWGGPLTRATKDVDLLGLQTVAVAKLLEDLLESGGTSVKTGLDYFLEELSVMAVAGTLQHGRHYVYQDGRLALHFAPCHAAYCEHSRRTGFEGEVPDRKAMRRQVQESHRRNGYVLETDARVCFNGRDDRRRAVLIDIERAKETLDVDDFPVPEPEVGTGYRGWEQD